MYVILSFMLQVVKSPPRTSGSALLRHVEIDLFRLHQNREPAKLKKKKDENVDSHVGFKFPVKVPRIVGAICRYSWGIHQPRSRWFQDCKVNAIASYKRAGRCAVPIRVVRCAPVIPSVGLDLLSCSFTFVIALADVKKISSTFTMTYSSFPWRRRLFSL